MKGWVIWLATDQGLNLGPSIYSYVYIIEATVQCSWAKNVIYIFDATLDVPDKA